jgi:hypothetical protein
VLLTAAVTAMLCVPVYEMMTASAPYAAVHFVFVSNKVITYAHSLSLGFAAEYEFP